MRPVVTIVISSPCWSLATLMASLVTGSNMNLWDREELSLAGKESEKPPER